MQVMMIQEHKKVAEDSELSEEEDILTEKVNLFNNIDAQMQFYS